MHMHGALLWHVYLTKKSTTETNVEPRFPILNPNPNPISLSAVLQTEFCRTRRHPPIGMIIQGGSKVLTPSSHHRLKFITVEKFGFEWIWKKIAGPKTDYCCLKFARAGGFHILINFHARFKY